ncbi:MAG: hypothetical protein QOH10_1295 [Actinomycetota bacterium]|jgi:cell division protein FtsL|nr:hypothetical protein [Actinomycetota bacterium]
MILPDARDFGPDAAAAAELHDRDLDDIEVDDEVDALVVEVDDIDVDVVELDREVETGRRHLRVAPDSYRRRRHVRIAAGAAAISISATLFAVVGFNVELAQHQIQLQSVQRQLHAEQTRYYELRNEVAQRSSPSQIVSIAQQRGLVTAQPTYVRAPIKPPPADPTGTAKLLEESRDATRSSLDPVQ